ncbi:hypothetical protein LUX01_13060 [Streptomyces sudanensis]|uniref:hypothetical protein n=1 Tax=Streptomyces sudanensis TaxID=436397 RepID=UPI0020CBABBF|nr:hypothetical protein [Streptomyces sudanensis]MCP9987476.1 hypothetical protein [Streptomyces sudanensis]
MEEAVVRVLVRRAQEAGRIPVEALRSTSGEFGCEASQVNRENLLRIYHRRLRRTPPGSALHNDTLSLVEFLEASREENLTMIGIRPEKGGFDLFLADREAHDVLFWMRMFSRHQGTC